MTNNVYYCLSMCSNTYFGVSSYDFVSLKLLIDVYNPESIQFIYYNKANVYPNANLYSNYPFLY